MSGGLQRGELRPHFQWLVTEVFYSPIASLATVPSILLTLRTTREH